MEIIDFNDDEKVINIDENVEPEDEEFLGDDGDDDDEEITFGGVVKEIFSLVIYLAITFAIVFCIITFVGQRTVVNGSSMEDTLSNGDNIIVDKITPHFSEFKRFEVIIFPPKGEENTLYIKRIIGLPGESVFIDSDGSIYIDQVKLDDPYGTETIRVPGLASQTIYLGNDEYFVLGDNRNNSLDSRFEQVGNVKRDDITGRAWLRFFPFNKWGIVKNIE